MQAKIYKKSTGVSLFYFKIDIRHKMQYRLYNISKNPMLGKRRLDRKKIIVKKYINDGNCATGYFSKINFMNMIGLSTQMPI